MSDPLLASYPSFIYDNNNGYYPKRNLTKQSSHGINYLEQLENVNQSLDGAQSITDGISAGIDAINSGWATAGLFGQNSMDDLNKMLDTLHTNLSSLQKNVELSGEVVAGIGNVLNLILEARNAYNEVIKLSNSTSTNDKIESGEKLAGAAFHFVESFGGLAEHLKGLSTTGFLPKLGKFFNKINPCVSAIVNSYDGFFDGIKKAEERGDISHDLSDIDMKRIIAAGVGGATGAVAGDATGKIIGATFGALIGGPLGAFIGGILGSYFGADVGTDIGSWIAVRYVNNLSEKTKPIEIDPNKLIDVEPPKLNIQTGTIGGDVSPVYV